MIYFIIAFALWVGGKIFFYNPKAIEESFAQTAAASLMVTAFLCIPACFFIDNGEKKETKKVTLTVTDRVEKKEKIYLRFSDGYTQTAPTPGYGGGRASEKWLIVQKGDKVQKVIYPYGECEYTPVFDEPPISE